MAAGQGSSGLLEELRKRQLCGTSVSSRFFVEDLTSDAGCNGCGSIAVDPQCVPTPPFAVAYSEVYNDSKLLAIADEDGYISIVDTTAQLPQGLGLTADKKPRAQWLAHNNAVFDVAWCKGDEAMVTGSGDQTVALWDTGHAERVAVLEGHKGSIKSVAVQPSCPHIVASGARDGAIMIWDTRKASVASSSIAPVLVVQNAHGYEKKAARRRTVTKHPNAVQSVTRVLFLHNDLGFVSGGINGAVRFWDLRKVGQPTAQLRPGSQPRRVDKGAQLDEIAHIPPQAREGKCGITWIAQDPSGNRLAVSVSNHTHYIYDSLRPELPAVAELRGHTSGSFYIKSAFSPKGTHLVSGSSDGNVYVWQVDRPVAQPHVLKGHENEVTAVAWCPADFGQIASCGDDHTVRVWGIQRPWPPAPRPASAASCFVRLGECTAAAASGSMAPPTPQPPLTGARSTAQAPLAHATTCSAAARPPPAVGSHGGGEEPSATGRATPFTPREPQGRVTLGASKRMATSCGGKPLQRSILDFLTPLSSSGARVLQPEEDKENIANPPGLLSNKREDEGNEARTAEASCRAGIKQCEVVEGDIPATALNSTGAYAPESLNDLKNGSMRRLSVRFNTTPEVLGNSHCEQNADKG